MRVVEEIRAPSTPELVRAIPKVGSTRMIGQLEAEVVETQRTGPRTARVWSEVPTAKTEHQE